MGAKPWKRLNRRVIARTSIFTVLAEKWRSPDGRSRQTFYFLEAPEWVNVIALDEHGKVLLIRQPRYGSRRTELEIPGGAVDRRDSGPLAAAKRELLEETGCAARKWVSLGWVSPNPAFQRNRCHTYLALGARKVAEQNLEPAEDITVVRCPLSGIPRMIGRGRIPHSLVVAAFCKLQNSPGILRRRDGRRKIS